MDQHKNRRAPRALTPVEKIKFGVAMIGLMLGIVAFFIFDQAFQPGVTAERRSQLLLIALYCGFVGLAGIVPLGFHTQQRGSR